MAAMCCIERSLFDEHIWWVRLMGTFDEYIWCIIWNISGYIGFPGKAERRTLEPAIKSIRVPSDCNRSVRLILRLIQRLIQQPIQQLILLSKRFKQVGSIKNFLDSSLFQGSGQGSSNSIHDFNLLNWFVCARCPRAYHPKKKQIKSDFYFLIGDHHHQLLALERQETLGRQKTLGPSEARE